MNFFRRNANKTPKNGVEITNIIVDDPSGLEVSGLDRDNNSLPINQDTVNDLMKQIKNLNQQNQHLNKYIQELANENEQLQDRLSDMKVTI